MSDKFSSIETQASYGIGLQMGEQLRSNPFEGLDVEAVQEGLADAYNNLPAQVDNDTLRVAFNQIHEINSPNSMNSIQSINSHQLKPIH